MDRVKAGAPVYKQPPCQVPVRSSSSYGNTTTATLQNQLQLTLPGPPCCCGCMLPPHWPPCMPRPAAQPPPPAASLLLPAPSVSELLPLSLPPAAAGADEPGLPLPGRGGPRSCSPRKMRNSSSLRHTIMFLTRQQWLSAQLPERHRFHRQPFKLSLGSPILKSLCAPSAVP